MTIPLSGAGLTRRLAALLYDVLLVLALMMIVSLIFLPFNDGDAPTRGTLLFQLHRLALFVIVFGFFSGFWLADGQTLGMRAWRLRLVRADGAPLRLRDCAIRLAAAVIALAPAGLGLLWILVDRHRLAWHDRLSGTVVLHTG